MNEDIPIQSLIIKRNVVFQFDFHLTDRIISKEEKISLFMNILLDIGIGARRNIGFGCFRNFKIN